MAGKGERFVIAWLWAVYVAHAVVIVAWHLVPFVMLTWNDDDPYPYGVD